MAIKVAYWSIRGLGAPLRMMCEHAGVEYDAVLYDCQAKDGAFDTSSWFTVKPGVQAQNPLANLPYVEVDGVVVTQSSACMTFLGAKLGLLGANDAEKVECEQLLCEVMDFRNACCSVFYGGDLGGLSALAKNASLRKLNAWLAHKGTNFLVGQTPTAPDFHLWELLDELKFLAGANGGVFVRCVGLHEWLVTRLRGCLGPYCSIVSLRLIFTAPIFLPSGAASWEAEGYGPLATFYGAFGALPFMASYQASSLGALPCNNKMASFGATPEGGVWDHTKPQVGGGAPNKWQNRKI
jgi:glutathione S-transferase